MSAPTSMSSPTETVALPASELTKGNFEQMVNQPAPTRTRVNGGDRSKLAPLESFAQEAKENADIVSDFFRNNSLPHPSFAADAPANAFVSVPDNVIAARAKLTEASLKLLQMVQGPQEYIPNLAVNVRKQSLCLQQWQELMITDPIRGMSQMAYSLLHLPASAANGYNLVSRFGQTGKSVCQAAEDRHTHGYDFKSLL